MSSAYSAMCLQLYLAVLWQMQLRTLLTHPHTKYNLMQYLGNLAKVLELPYHTSHHQTVKLKKLCLSRKTQHPQFALLHTVQSTKLSSPKRKDWYYPTSTVHCDTHLNLNGACGFAVHLITQHLCWSYHSHEIYFICENDSAFLSGPYTKHAGHRHMSTLPSATSYDAQECEVLWWSNKQYMPTVLSIFVKHHSVRSVFVLVRYGRNSRYGSTTNSSGVWSGLRHYVTCRVLTF
jgi:hypothetical protein